LGVTRSNHILSYVVVVVLFLLKIGIAVCAAFIVTKLVLLPEQFFLFFEFGEDDARL
jgi:hypothetical protein